MEKYIFKKEEIYSYIAKAVKHQGYTDGEYGYYNDNDGTWYAINYWTGLAICCGETLEECYQRVHSEHFQNLLKEAENSKTYIEKCLVWLKAMLELKMCCEPPSGIVWETTF